MGIRVTKDDNFEQVLKRVEVTLRGKALVKAARAGGNVIKKRAKQLAPRGDEAHNPGKPALADTIAVVIRQYSASNGGVVLAVVGPAYPDGAHGHLIEDGHRIVTHDGEYTGFDTDPKEFMAPAGDQTQTKQKQAVSKSLAKSIKKAEA